MSSADIIVIGAGIAGLSAASALSAHARVIVLEAEEAAGFHSSGRSATMLHYALGDPLIRALTLASRGFFEDPPEGFTEVPLGHRHPVLVHARGEEVDALDQLHADIAPFADLERVGEEGIAAACPVIRTGVSASVAALIDRVGIRLDPHAMLQGHTRLLNRSGGKVVTGAVVERAERGGDAWKLATNGGDSFSAPILINAAGAWADDIAIRFGIEPLGLTPLKRTIITFDGPAGVDTGGWPFAKTVHDELYFAPESGRLFASPMDEGVSEPCDAQADEYEVALAAHRIEERTTLKVDRIHSRWAGLRTFAPDRHPVVGFDPRAEGFFWLAGQGGFGLQTSPVMAAVAQSLIAGTPWPTYAVSAEELSAARFLG